MSTARKTALKRALELDSATAEAGEVKIEPSQAKRARENAESLDNLRAVCPRTGELLPFGTRAYAIARRILETKESEVIVRWRRVGVEQFSYLRLAPDYIDAGEDPCPFRRYPLRTIWVTQHRGKVTCRCGEHQSVSWEDDRAVLSAMKWKSSLFTSSKALEIPEICIVRTTTLPPRVKWSDIEMYDDDQCLISKRSSELPARDALTAVLSDILSIVPVDVVASVLVPFCMFKDIQVRDDVRLFY
jgi:hypothetical protein